MNSFATAFQVYVAALVFSRVGAMVMTMPGIGEQSVPPRIRLSFALLMALILGPLVADTVPPIPSTLGGRWPTPCRRSRAPWAVLSAR